MGKTDPFIQFYPTGFTQWIKLTVPTLARVDALQPGYLNQGVMV